VKYERAKLDTAQSNLGRIKAHTRGPQKKKPVEVNPIIDTYRGEVRSRALIASAAGFSDERTSAEGYLSPARS
jgi:hypothetical protein